MTKTFFQKLAEKKGGKAKPLSDAVKTVMPPLREPKRPSSKPSK